MADPSILLLSRIFRYDANAGILYWRARPAWMFAPKWGCRQKAARNWNSRCADKQAGTLSNGYLRVPNLFGRRVYVHRIIMAMLNDGSWPECVDHIDGDTLNNRPNNLRSVTHKTNMRNMKRHSTNTSGVVGVSWAEREGKWSAFIYRNGRKASLGNHAHKSDAIAARKRAEQEQGYHRNHGRAA